jgi:hypothetical protein
VNPDIVVDWLAKNDQYAKSIVQLAGIRVGEVKDGVPIRVQALWDGVGFVPPLVFSIPLKEGTLTWSGDTVKTALFRKTLGLLSETFQSMTIPKRVIVFDGEINLETKRLHFKSFEFGTIFAVPANNVIVLNKTIDKIDVMQEILRKFVTLRRKLRGIGYDGN